MRSAAGVQSLGLVLHCQTLHADAYAAAAAAAAADDDDDMSLVVESAVHHL